MSEPIQINDLLESILEEVRTMRRYMEEYVVYKEKVIYPDDYLDDEDVGPVEMEEDQPAEKIQQLIRLSNSMGVPYLRNQDQWVFDKAILDAWARGER